VSSGMARAIVTAWLSGSVVGARSLSKTVEKDSDSRPTWLAMSTSPKGWTEVVSPSPQPAAILRPDRRRAGALRVGLLPP
jgi:hypothetical protein